MRKPLVVINLSPRMYAKLAGLGNAVVAALTANLHFTTPAVPLATLTGAVTDVEDAIAAWGPRKARGSHDELLTLRDKALTLHQLLHSEAEYVQLTAQTTAGSNYSEMAAILGTSGYELKGDPNKQGVLQMVQGLHHFASRKLAQNQVKLKWKRPLNVTSGNNVRDYRILRGTTADFTAAVEIGSTTRTSFIDTNDTAATVKWTYWVVPFNNAGPGVPSDGLTISVLNA
jgi:hypothetical protein